eukprot:244888-Rhodomonas_salina.1
MSVPSQAGFGACLGERQPRAPLPQTLSHLVAVLVPIIAHHCRSEESHSTILGLKTAYISSSIKGGMVPSTSSDLVAEAAADDSLGQHNVSDTA